MISSRAFRTATGRLGHDLPPPLRA